jgi:hypothetical protein
MYFLRKSPYSEVASALLTLTLTSAEVVRQEPLRGVNHLFVVLPEMLR